MQRTQQRFNFDTVEKMLDKTYQLFLLSTKEICLVDWLTRKTGDRMPMAPVFFLFSAIQ